VSDKRDFWLSCGHHLLDRDAGGWLLIGNDFLKAYFARPEIAPPPEACPAELTLHAGLLADPRRPVLASEIAEIMDADARENWQLMIDFRNYMVGHATLEDAYLNLVRQRLKFPHLFLNHLVHLILRNVLDGCDDAFVLRAAELFFRPQKMTSHEGSLLAIDEETLSGVDTGSVSSLLTMLGSPAVAQIDVLNEGNANSYWERSDLFNLALDVTAGRRGQDALGQVARRWISHLLTIDVNVEPLTAMREVPLTWYVGLDAEGTRIGDELWHGNVVDAETLARVVALYRLTFCEPALVNDSLKGEPVYLILAMAADGMLRLKPQNILTGLPLRQLEVIS
jgi:hypothetical protein